MSGPRATGVASSLALVWIDAREAAIARWDGETGTVDHLASEVPVHRSAIGHVRRSPLTRQGGGQSQDAADNDRLEHLEHFLGQVVERLEPSERVVIIGPGTVREHLERRLREAGHDRGADRLAGGGPAGPLTDRQLIARLRDILGDAAPRGFR